MQITHNWHSYKWIGDKWGDIPWYEWRYKINVETNEVMTVKYKWTSVSKILKNYTQDSGHIWVTLYKENQKKTWKFHQLVMLIKEWPCTEWLEVCHNDWNPLNNHPDNLRYDTHSSNIKDMYLHGTKPTLVNNFTKKSKPVLKIFRGWVVGYWDSLSSAARENWVNHSYIRACCEGSKKELNWFTWKYFLPVI